MFILSFNSLTDVFSRAETRLKLVGVSLPESLRTDVFSRAETRLKQSHRLLGDCRD